MVIWGTFRLQMYLDFLVAFDRHYFFYRITLKQISLHIKSLKLEFWPRLLQYGRIDLLKGYLIIEQLDLE